MNLEEIVKISNMLYKELDGDTTINIHFDLTNDDCRDITINIDVNHMK